MKKQPSYSQGIAILFFLLLVVFPGAWFLLDKTNYLSNLGLIDPNNPPSEWSAVFIGYFGSAISAIAGYVAVILSLSIQEKARKEDKAKEVLPLLSASPTSCSTKWEDRLTIDLKHTIQPKNESSSNSKETIQHLSRNGVLLKNVGMREMYDIRITNIESDFFISSNLPVKLIPILYKDSAVVFDIMLEAIGPQPECIEITNRTFKNKSYARVIFDITYHDCYGNRYTQKMEAKISYNFEARKMPALIFSNTGVEGCAIISAPLQQE